jgi:tRNA nucleotidyltransferase (CCA-adding enzyme)
LLRLALLFAPTGAQQSAVALKSLRYSNQDVAWVSGIIERQPIAEELLGNAMAAGVAIQPVELRRLVSRSGRLRVRSVFRLAAARWDAKRHAGLDAPSSPTVHSLYREALRTAFREPVELSDLAIDGDDLRHAGFAPGPILGKILQALLDWVLEDPARNTRDRLLARAIELRGNLGQT